MPIKKGIQLEIKQYALKYKLKFKAKIFYFI